MTLAIDSTHAVAAACHVPKFSDPLVSVHRLDSNRDIHALIPAWHALMRRSLWHNPCYGPDFLLPVRKHLADRPVSILVVRSAPCKDGQVDLLGLMPIVQKAIYRLPLKSVGVWRPDNTFDGTPILDRDRGSEALIAMLDALADEGVRLVELDTVSAAEEIQTLINHFVQLRDGSVFVRRRYERAALCPEENVDEYLHTQLSKNRRKKARTQLKRLQSRGTVQFETCDQPAEVEASVQQFIDLEASGWKGRDGTALASQPSTHSFAVELTRRMAATGGVRFARLLLDGRPIAMLFELLAGDKVYGFKTAYDERYAEYSPGALLEIQNIRWLHETDCSIADACTVPDNELLNSLYSKRLPFQDLVLGLGGATKPWVRRVMPMMQSAARTIRAWPIVSNRG